MKIQQVEVAEIFEHKEFGQVRVIMIGDMPWFVAKDVAIVLGYTNTRKAIADHVDEEDKKDGVTIRDSIGREQRMTVINESGVYSLIIRSNLPKARGFKRWLTSELLPTLRKHGYYAMPGHNEYFELNKVTSEKFLKVVKVINNYNRACYDLNTKKKRMYELSKEWLELDKECKALETKKQELIEKVDESMQEFFEMDKRLKVEDRDLVEAIASKEELS